MMLPKIDLKDHRSVSRELFRLDEVVRAKHGTIRYLQSSQRDALVEHYKEKVKEFKEKLRQAEYDATIIPQRIVQVKADIVKVYSRKKELKRYLPTQLLGKLAAIVKDQKLSKSQALAMLEAMLGVNHE